MSQIVVKLGLAMALGAMLPSCFGAEILTVRTAGPVTLNYNFGLDSQPHVQPSLPVGQLAQEAVDRRSVAVHGFPVMVQTMTKNMPGWNHWNATHMITIFAFDFSHNNPALDTVTYAETPSPLAGYRGPDFQTISVSALWAAMQAYTVASPSDPMNVIS